MWAIDHGIAFHWEYKLRTVLWDFVGQPLPPDITAALCHFQEALNRHTPIYHTLAELLDQNEMHALRRRLDTLIANGSYPEPGHGPNVPWPPI
jgi:uncharacterized repeat protein (TIGR03843 family)